MSGTMSRLVTMHRLHFNSSDYRDSCYATWVGTKETVNTHTQFWMDVYDRRCTRVCSSWRLLYKSLPESRVEATVIASHCTRHYSNLTCKWLIQHLFHTPLLKTDWLASVSWRWLGQASRNVETNFRTDSAIVQLIIVRLAKVVVQANLLYLPPG